MKSTGEQIKVLNDLRRISENNFLQLAQIALGIRLTREESVRLRKQLLKEWSV